MLKVKEEKNITIFEIPKEEINKIEFHTCAEPTQTLESFYKSAQEKPDVLINGGFFNLKNGTPTMDLIDNGKQRANDMPWNSYGIGITKDGLLKCGYENDGWHDFISGYPPLVINKQYNTMNIAGELNYKARRSIIGYNNTTVFLIAIDLPGATYAECAKIALDLGCDQAINLDGGGSTRALYEGKAYAVAKTNRPVDNIIGVYLKKEEKIIYRVQVGAFAMKENAVGFCLQVRALGGAYASAYVRKIGNLYKVQVGAFAIKSNAINMMNDLKAKGFNAFITT